MLYNNSGLVTHFTMATLNKRTLIQYMQFIFGLGIINLLLSLYMAFGNIESGACDISAKVSCNSVIKSEYGYIFGIPVSYYGITWNLVLLYCIWRIYLEDKIPAYITTLYVWCSIGIGFVFYFVAAELILGKMCPFCTIVHIVNVAMMYLTFKVYCDLKSAPPLMLVATSLKSFIASVVILHVLMIVFLNGSSFGNGGTGVIGGGGSNKITDETFSQCLTRKNMVMFGSSSCGACINQKKLFLVQGKGEAESPWAYIKFIECSGDKAIKEECEKVNIQRYPTWLRFENQYSYDSTNTNTKETEDDNNNTENNSTNKILEKHEGVMNINELSKMSGCEIKHEPIELQVTSKK